MQIDAGSLSCARICPSYLIEHAFKECTQVRTKLLPVSLPPDHFSIVHALYIIYAIFPQMPNSIYPLDPEEVKTSGSSLSASIGAERFYWLILDFFEMASDKCC